MANDTSDSSAHTHGKNCGHTGIHHSGHVDYLVDGKLEHCENDGSTCCHTLEVSGDNPACCQPLTDCAAKGHEHGPGCGHEAIQHGDHVDYIVDGRLHHTHNGHCDDHGPVTLA